MSISLNRRELLTLAGAGITVTAVPSLFGPPAANAAASAPSTAGLAHPDWLVDVEWLSGHLDDPSLKIIGFQEAEEFALAHLPGSLHVDQAMLGIKETDETSVAEWRTGLTSQLTALGIEPDDRVVIYDGGDFYAARVWWALDQIGHADKRVLNGGLLAWEAAGLVVETGNAAVVEPAAAVHPLLPNDDAIATIDEVLAALDAGLVTFVDARKSDAYAKGHIPGAISIPLEENPVGEPPPYLKSADDLRAIYAAVDPAKPVIPYCQGGVRSAATYFVLRQLGYEQVSLFTGSWAEWSADPARPVETGA